MSASKGGWSLSHLLFRTAAVAIPFAIVAAALFST
jgi:hypothetical protein